MSVEAHYQIEAPKYSSDYHFARRNPAWSIGSEYCLPTIRCSNCGTWISLTFLIGEAPHDRLIEFSELSELTFLPTTEWRERAVLWAKALKQPVAKLESAMHIGRPKLEIRGRQFNDFTFATFVDLVFVQDDVKSAIENAGFTGVSFLEAITVVKKAKLRGFQAPRLWQLQVSGTVETIVTMDPGREHCEECGRVTYAPPIDENRMILSTWDGSDFFCQGPNPSLINVTSRVKEFIEDSGFTNVAFKRWADPIE